MKNKNRLVKLKKQKRYILGALSILCAAMLTGCGAAQPTETAQQSQEQQTESEIDENLIMVGFAQVGAESDWRIAQTTSVQSALTEENGFYLVFENAQQKQENQLKAIRKFILQEVDYIVLDPIVVSGWTSVLQEAKEAGIPVIILDRYTDVEDDSLYACWLGSDFHAEGKNAGEWLANYLKKEGREKEEINIVSLNGTSESAAQIGRTEGFAEVLEQQKNWKLLDSEDGDFTQAKGRECMESFLEKYDDIDVAFCENDNMAFGAIDAIEAAGKTCGPDGDIIVISFDAVKAALEAMEKGEINAVFECNPLSGPQLAEIIKQLEAGEEIEKIQYMDETYFDTTMDLEKIIAERTY